MRRDFDTEKNKDAGYVRGRRKVCRFCEDKIDYVNYMDDRLLRRYTNERGKIIPRRVSGTCARHQRTVTAAIKRSRLLAVMPFASESYR
jgi:small subunit ribosomal protein S18